jgi:hypothetical protein
LEDKKWQGQLSEGNLENVIGVNMLLTIPPEEMKNHLDINKINALDLFCNTNIYMINTLL